MSNLLSTIDDKGGVLTAQHFAELERVARARVKELDDEQVGDWIHSVVSACGVVACFCLSPASPAVAAIGAVSTIAANLYGHGQFLGGGKGIQLAHAKAMALAMNDATEKQWEELYIAADSKDLFVKALESGLLETGKGDIDHGDIFRKAAAYINAVNPDSIEGFSGKTPTALIAPSLVQPKSVLPVTGDEITHICEICSERIRQSADTKWAAKIIADAKALHIAGNRKGAANKLIYNSKMIEKEFVKEGVPKARLKLIKEWAASGASPDQPSDVLILQPEPQLQLVTAALPAPELAATVPLATPATASVIASQELEEPETEEEDEPEIEDTEEEDDTGEIAETSIVQTVIKPAAQPLFRSNRGIQTPIAQSIWDTTDLDTIEAAETGNVNKFPFIIIVAPQGTGKTVTLAWLFEQLSGNKALFTPKIDDHRNPAIQSVYDVAFGYNPKTDRGSWFGDQSSFHNGDSMDLDWYLKHNRAGSALDFIGAVCSTAKNRTSKGTKKGRKHWRVFYDESNQVYTGGFTMTEIDGVPQGERGAKDCQWFIESNLKSSLFNFRGAAVQMWVSCISETVQNIGFKGCADALGEAWHLYPGAKAIEVARKGKQLKLAAFLERAIDDGYAISILEKDGQFKIIRMPKLAELERFDPIIEEDDEDEETFVFAEDEDLDPSWGIESTADIDREPAIVASVKTETLNEMNTSIKAGTRDEMIGAIMAMTQFPAATRLQMIGELNCG